MIDVILYILLPWLGLHFFVYYIGIDNFLGYDKFDLIVNKFNHVDKEI